MNFSYVKKVLKKTSRECFFYFRNGEFGKLRHFIFFWPKHFLSGYPKTITIEPVNFCNCHCEFCSAPPRLLERPARVMSLPEFKKIIDDIKNLTHYLWLFLAGDPLMNPEFPKMVAYANANHLDTTTSTNANRLTPDVADELISSGIDRLILSLDGTTEKTYEQMRRGGNFNTVMRNIEYLVAAKKKRGRVKPYLELQFIETKVNQHEKEDFIKLAKKLGVAYAIKSLGLPTWIFDDEICRVIKEKYLPEGGKKRYHQDLSLKRLKNCQNVARSVILSDGTVCPCCYDVKGKINLGNALKESFLTIWQSEKYQKVRKAMAKRQLNLCKVCGESYEL